MKFSNSAWKVWAKKQGDQSLWLPLIVHLADCVDVAERLWENWLSDGIKMKLAEPFNSIETAKRVFIFIVATHDLAKATVLFQSKPSFPTPNPIDDELVESLILTGLDVIPYQEQMNNNNSPHAFAGEVMLLIRGCPKSVAVIVGSHHGKPSSFNYDAKSNKDKTIAHAYYRSYNKHYLGKKEHSQTWLEAQEEFIQFALEKSGFDKITDLPDVNQESQMIYTGLLIMADWIASNTNYYPLFSLDENVQALDFHSRHQNAWEKLNLPYGYRQQFSIDEKILCEERFGFTPNELQKSVVEIAQNMNGGIMVIEAPMGIGKTESALLVAEMFMNQQQRTGVFFALPTQATSDGIFIRFKEWMDMLDDEQHSFQLSHGKAQFNDEFMKMDRLGGSSGIWAEENQKESGAVVHTWFEGSKKALLADFVIGTIDQLLMVALKQKHLMLRHLGIANKVVIIDECHAYDAYMSHYLHRALHWLGAYNVPVIILSATLPVEKRKYLVTQYLGVSKKKARNTNQNWMVSEEYPLITYTRDNEVFQQTLKHDESTEKRVAIKPIEEQILFEILENLNETGACIGIIVNTVKRSQTIFEELNKHFEGYVELLHSAFLAPDRIKKEQNLLSQLGKKGKRPHFKIVVGTQVLEQSLDIDFDIMITDLCPMDLILQRIGRLHRHKRIRPKGLEKAICYVMNVDELEKGATAIYGEFLLERTRAFLQDEICLPLDIAPLVQRVYAIDEDLSPIPNGYYDMKKEFKDKVSDKEQKADGFRIDNVDSKNSNKTIHKMLDNTFSSVGEAQVRDTEPTIEVLLVQRTQKGINLIGKNEIISQNHIPDELMAKLIARQSIRLPNSLSKKWNIEETIEILEKQTITYLNTWQETRWLKGELFLILDENLQANINGFCLQYDENKGLMFKKEGV